MNIAFEAKASACSRDAVNYLNREANHQLAEPVKARTEDEDWDSNRNGQHEQ